MQRKTATPASQSTTVVLTLISVPGRYRELLDVFDELKVLEKSMAVPGAIDTWLAQDAEQQDQIYVFTRWGKPSDYDGWLKHPDRAVIVQHLLPLLAVAPTIRIHVPPEHSGSLHSVAPEQHP
ncbi:antibiotic biosynthesis monooxygenase family protein [Pseudomonas sp. NPDC089401]|uniref:antibiotic biosynthesis monooxygenase family protein n=1 Tax=Pseudomonas sp. NPDC089401 TaxID=3364462 RepID=UPI00381F355C